MVAHAPDLREAVDAPVSTADDLDRLRRERLTSWAANLSAGAKPVGFQNVAHAREQR